MAPLSSWNAWILESAERGDKSLFSMAAGAPTSFVILDPTYALAYVGIADSYALAASGLRPPERFPLAPRSSESSDLARRRSCRSSRCDRLYFNKYYWEWSTAEREFKRAIELNPNGSTAHLLRKGGRGGASAINQPSVCGHHNGTQLSADERRGRTRDSRGSPGAFRLDRHSCIDCL